MENRKIKQEELLELSNSIYENSRKHGWHDKKQDLGHYRVMTVTELSEAIEADRKNKRASMTLFEENLTSDNFQENFEKYIKDTLEDEFADTIIRLLDWRKAKEYDIYKSDRFGMGDIYGNINEMSFTEFVDIIIYILYYDYPRDSIVFVIDMICRWGDENDVDIWKHVKLKMRYNEKRLYKHGNKKY